MAGLPSRVVPGEWDDEAEHWIRWARTPGFDAYWYYRDAFFDSVLPPPGDRTLEIGCGEGRVARDLVARGHRVTAVDTADRLVRAARDADPVSHYVVADGAGLPVASASVDLVVAYNALQVVADMSTTVAECGRVLVPGGHLCICVAHPVTDLGDWSEDGRLTVRSPYFEQARVDETVERDGICMTFRGWTHTLEEYASALEAAGLVIERIREPVPPADSPHRRWTAVPLFMNVRARKA